MVRGMTQRRPFLSRHSPCYIGLVSLLFGTLACIGLTSGLQAGDGDRANELATIRAAVQRGELLSLPRILALAQARVPGDVVKTELEVKHKRLIYEVKILTRTGRVKEVNLDARTGTILRVEDD